MWPRTSPSTVTAETQYTSAQMAMVSVPVADVITCWTYMFPVAAVVVELKVWADTRNSRVAPFAGTEMNPWPLTESFFWGPRAEAAAGITASTANENESAIAIHRTGC